MKQLIQEKQFLSNYIHLLEKLHKIHSVLKVHRKWENEKMFGSLTQKPSSLPAEYHYFSLRP